MHVVSIQVGKRQTYGNKNADSWFDRLWTSGIFKYPVEGRVWVGKTNIEGDEQADLQHHGGADKAVLGYAALHYPHFRERFYPTDFPYGGFGENLTIADCTEEDVCIGDVFELGSAILQISQPRLPCWKLARRFRIKDLALYVQKTGYTGWYFRVLQEGKIEKGENMRLLERPHPEWTISRCNKVIFHETHPNDMIELALCPALAEDMSSWLQKKAKSLQTDSANTGNSLL